MARKGTVESSLSAEALHDFCERLASLPNLTLEKMRDEAKKIGITLSHGAAGRFANGAFAEHLRRLQRAREFNEQVQAFNASGIAGSLADTAAATILQDICDNLASGEYNISKMAQAVATLQAGEHRRRELAERLKEYERRAADWERKEAERKAALAALSEKSVGKKITPEFIDEVQKTMGLK